MRSNFKVISLSYKNAPVEIREMIALDDTLIANLLNDFREVIGLDESLIISTCNRTEVYYNAEQDFSREIITLLAAKKGIDNISKFIPFFTAINDSNAASTYLFRVALGLEAQVIGDLQIINQVKKAYQIAADNNTAGPFMHRILHTVFFANKKVFQETAFRDGAASVSYATAELTRNLAESFIDAKVLIIGLGEIGEDLAKHLSGEQFSVSLTNRTSAKTEMLATELSLNQVPFANLNTQLDAHDIIISSIPVKDFIGPKHFEKTTSGLKFLVDLSIPRSIDPKVEAIQGVSLYNIDEIQEKTSKAVEKRKAAIPHVEAIIEDAMEDVRAWSREMEVSPTIQKLKNTLEEIRQEELRKHLKNSSEEMEFFADKLSKSITQKIMKLPVLQLKAACQRGDADKLVDVLNDLFNLEQEAKEK
ncbi:glutamyl-tRNA reductase [Roseivirga sp. E12]|uniref:glutamyl-tRNA reductase n=1 Tax=Roseivirga sp. E12 TaxID=2819237 RepID=UPI001ABCA3F1|nr:glutamyl-tRNA reductase [Roseivirga sp. E12]MBO3700784.1 glutamyl-tRNA reductase [Roseivirga sp. E12]